MRNEVVEPVQITPREARTSLVRMRVQLDQACAQFVRACNQPCPHFVSQLDVVGRSTGESGGRDQLGVDYVEHAIAKYADSEPEAEANWFAAELLMPKALFTPAIAGTMPSPEVINGLADYFLVTRTAAAVRYVDLCTKHSIFIMCEAGRIKWWRCSEELEGPLWISSGSRVPPNSLAGLHFAGNPSPAECQSADIADWASRHPEYTDDFTEAIIPLGRTGAVIVMLWIE